METRVREVATNEINPNVLHLHKSFYETIINNVEHLMKRKRLTLQDLATDNNWNYSALHRALYRNQTISSLWLARLSIGLEVDIYELMKRNTC